MKTTVNKWGNSLAVRIPQALAEVLGLREGTTVDINAGENRLIIEKPTFTLDELLATYDGPEPEYDWGPPRGKEIW